MKLLVDGQFTPGVIIDICQVAAKKADLDFMLIRSREKDLYQKQSDEYIEEVRKTNSFEALQPILEIMRPGDLLVTSDNELASQALHRVTAVIHPDGKIYTAEGIDLTTIDEYLARIYGRQDTRPKRLLHRDPKLDEKFKQALFQFIGNIE